MEDLNDIEYDIHFVNWGRNFETRYEWVPKKVVIGLP